MHFFVSLSLDSSPPSGLCLAPFCKITIQSADRPCDDLVLVMIGGCLAMVYMTSVTSPVATEFYRKIGAKEWQFGLIHGITMWMLVLQFLGAAITNQLARRKQLFFRFACPI